MFQRDWEEDLQAETQSSTELEELKCPSDLEKRPVWFMGYKPGEKWGRKWGWSGRREHSLSMLLYWKYILNKVQGTQKTNEGFLRRRVVWFDLHCSVGLLCPPLTRLMGVSGFLRIWALGLERWLGGEEYLGLVLELGVSRGLGFIYQHSHCDSQVSVILVAGYLIQSPSHCWSWF